MEFHPKKNITNIQQPQVFVILSELDNLSDCVSHWWRNILIQLLHKSIMD